MKHTIKSIIRTVKSVKGNSLAEFATTTALMATLAATAAPKLSEMSEGTKAEKSRNEIDKIVKQAASFYQDKADDEGRGRFPNQVKFNTQIGGARTYDNAGGSTTDLADAKENSRLHTEDIMDDLGLGDTDGWKNYSDNHTNDWVSVFGGYDGLADIDGDGACNPCDASDDPATPLVDETVVGVNEWAGLFGDEVLGSTFQDGHYVYTVVAGGGTGDKVYPPVLYVADIENACDFNNEIEP